jgi:hypothetical protein
MITFSKFSYFLKKGLRNIGHFYKMLTNDNDCYPKNEDDHKPIFVCETCPFKTGNRKDYKRHLNSNKHQKLTNVNNEMFKNLPQFNKYKNKCETCNYISCNNTDLKRHLKSKRHILFTNIQQHLHISSNENDVLTCKCGKKYKSRQGLYLHKKKCNVSEEKTDLTKNMVIELIQQNKELILENKEFKDKLFELASKPTTVVNNTKNIQNNKQFNLNIFLNETCKNAMNLSDFISSLVIKNEEFENMGKLGYVQGISNILIRGLKELDETKRPMHCTDRKRETIYIKENNVWNKELSRDKLKQLVLDVSFKNVRKIPAWKAEHPGCDDTSSNKYMDYVLILNQVMTGIHPDSDSDINKIIRNISGAVVLDKFINE